FATRPARTRLSTDPKLLLEPDWCDVRILVRRTDKTWNRRCRRIAAGRIPNAVSIGFDGRLGQRQAESAFLGVETVARQFRSGRQDRRTLCRSTRSISLCSARYHQGREEACAAGE